MDKQSFINSLQKNRINQLANSNKRMPSIAAITVNLAESAVRNVKSVAAGNAFKVDENTANERLNVCKTCEFFNQVQQRCSKCGCFMAVKTYLKAEKCPIGKW